MADMEPLGKGAGHNRRLRDMKTGRMKSKIQMKIESHFNRSNGTFGFCRPSHQKLRCTTAMLGAGVLLASQAVAGDQNDREKVDHVLLVSVDGMHQSDLAWYVQTHPDSTLAKLMAKGVDYSNASTPFPSDSFPGSIDNLPSIPGHDAIRNKRERILPPVTYPIGTKVQ